MVMKIHNYYMNLDQNLATSIAAFVVGLQTDIVTFSVSIHRSSLVYFVDQVHELTFDYRYYTQLLFHTR